MKVHSLPSPSPCAARGWGEQRGRRRCRGSRGRRGRTTAPVVPHGGGPGAGAAKPRRPVGPSPPLPALRRPPASSCGPGRSRRARRRRCSAAASRRSGVPARRSARRRGCGARGGRTAGSRPPLPVPGPGAAPAAARGGCSGPDRGSRLLALPRGPRPGRRLSDPAGRDDLPAGARRSTDGQGGGGGPGAALRVRPAVLGRFCSPRSFRRPRLRVAVGAARAPPPGAGKSRRQHPPARPKGGARPVPAERLLLLPAVLARCRRLPRGSGAGPEPPPAAAMPSPTDSSRSLTGRSSRSLTHLRLQRTWLQVLLVLGLVQAILGVLIVTFSLVAATITPSTKIRHSCPSWAGFSVSAGPRRRGEGAALLPGGRARRRSQGRAAPLLPHPLPVPAAVHCGRIPRAPPG